MNSSVSEVRAAQAQKVRVTHSGESQISLQRWLKVRRPLANTRRQPPRPKPRVRSRHRSTRG